MKVRISPPCSPFDRDETSGKFILEDGSHVEDLYVTSNLNGFFDVERQVPLEIEPFDVQARSVWMYTQKAAERYERYRRGYTDSSRLPESFEEDFFEKKHYSPDRELVFRLSLQDRGAHFDLQALPTVQKSS